MLATAIRASTLLVGAGMVAAAVLGHASSVNLADAATATTSLSLTRPTSGTQTQAFSSAHNGIDIQDATLRPAPYLVPPSPASPAGVRNPACLIEPGSQNTDGTPLVKPDWDSSRPGVCPDFEGAVVNAAGAGRVTFAGVADFGTDGQPHMVTINHGTLADGRRLETVYLHMGTKQRIVGRIADGAPVRSFVTATPNTCVASGTAVGKQGYSGMTTATHLHFGVRLVARDGTTTYEDPNNWIGRAVDITPPAECASSSGVDFLILRSSVSSPDMSGRPTSLEEQIIASLGMTSRVVDDATWASMTTAQFKGYKAIVLGDATCDFGNANAASANTAIWGAAVTGNVVAIGTDPVYHSFFGPGSSGNPGSGPYNLIKQSLLFAASQGAGTTGAYADLSCYYHGAAPHTPVTFLNAITPGGFTVTGVGCFNDAHIVATGPAIAGLTDADLSGWSCSVHEAFDKWPSDFKVLAIARGIGGSFTALDGTTGTPYIVARGAGVTFTPPPAGGTITGTVSGGGAPASGAFVEACLTDLSYCTLATADSAGVYTAAHLPAGTYRLRAHAATGDARLEGRAGPATISGTATVTLNLTLPGPTRPPAGTSITSLGTTSTGVPVVYWFMPLTLSTHGCTGGTATYQIVQGDSVVRSGGLTESPVGTYTALIAPLLPAHGDAHVVINLSCASAPIAFDIYIDPSGTVRTTAGAPLPGATVTLLHAETASGPFVVLPAGDGHMSAGNQQNPDVTDSNGNFGWDVLSGFYIVRASKSGCTSATVPGQAFEESAILTIPPPVSDLQLRLDCGAVDTTPPVTTATTTPAPNTAGWNNADVTVLLNATDESGGSGVHSISYRTAGPPQVATASSVRLAVASEGTTTLTYFATDNAGNAEAEKTLTVMLDKTSPTLTCGSTPSFYRGQAGAQVSATVVDSGSGPASASVTAPVNTTNVGAFTVQLSGVDVAGNSAAVGCPYRVVDFSLVTDGLNSFAEAAHAPELNLAGDRTIELWFKDEDPNGFNHGYVTLLNKGDRDTSRSSPYFVTLGFKRLLIGQRDDGNDRTVDVDLWALKVDARLWHHLAASYQASSRTLTVYLDGQQVASGQLASTGGGNALPVEIGRNGSASGKYFHGKLDDVRLWNVARSAKDIADNFQRELGVAIQPGLVANWHFDEGSGAAVADSAAAHRVIVSDSASFSADVHP